MSNDKKGVFLPDQTRLVWQELERRRGCLPRPRSSKSKEAKHSNNVFNTAVNFHLCLVNILQGFTWNVSWYGMPAQWGKRYSDFLIFDWCLKLCSLVWWLGCQASQHGKTDQFWSSHSFHVFFSKKIKRCYVYFSAGVWSLHSTPLTIYNSAPGPGMYIYSDCLLCIYVLNLSQNVLIIFLFLKSSLAHLEPKLERFEVWS